MREIILICLLLLYGPSSVVFADNIKPLNKDSLVCLYIEQVCKKGNPDKVKLRKVYVQSKEQSHAKDTLVNRKKLVSGKSSLRPILYGQAPLQGVYMLLNDHTGSFYIFSAKDIPAKVLLQKKALNKGSYPNKALQEAWRRYGELGFSYHLIQYVAGSYKQLEEREMYWRKRFNSLQRNIKSQTSNIDL